MSIETDLRSILTPLLAGGCHNAVNTASPVVFPYAVFHEITATPQIMIHGGSIATDRKYQVEVFAKSPEQAKGLSLGTVKAAIETAPTLGGVLTFSMNGEYDPVTKTHQYIAEYQIWEL